MFAYEFIFISEPDKFCTYTSKIIENDYKNIDKRVKNNYNCYDTRNIRFIRKGDTDMQSVKT